MHSCQVVILSNTCTFTYIRPVVVRHARKGPRLGEDPRRGQHRREEVGVRGRVEDIGVVGRGREHAGVGVDDEALRAGLLIVLPALRGADPDVIAQDLLCGSCDVCGGGCLGGPMPHQQAVDRPRMGQWDARTHVGVAVVHGGGHAVDRGEHGRGFD